MDVNTTILQGPKGELQVTDHRNEVTVGIDGKQHHVPAYMVSYAHGELRRGARYYDTWAAVWQAIETGDINSSLR